MTEWYYAKIEKLNEEIHQLTYQLSLSKAGNEHLRSLVTRFVACFETFDGSIGKSMQGWDYPRLQKVREDARATLQTGGEEP